MKIKICGIQKKEHIQVAIEAGVDYLGFVFAKSKRQISVSKARTLAVDIPKTIKKVGVFVNPTLTEIKQAIKEVPLDMVQLHGQESVEFVASISVPVIKAFPVIDGYLPEEISLYEECIILLDAPPAEYSGGSGETFDWEKIHLHEEKNQHFIIAGGLNEANVSSAIRYFQPFGVDVSSGVETRGEKDSKKIRKFIKNAKGVMEDE